MSNKVIDCFPYFDETGQELLKLRINMLKDHVDYFVITESNKTQSGRNIDRKLRQRIQQYNLPEDKIIVIDLDIPEDYSLDVQDIDALNCYDGNFVNKNSIFARVRERMQKDAVLSVLDKFNDDDVFILSDSDEIIRPDIIKFYSGEVLKYPNFILKFPLVHLEGRADLRVVNKESREPKWWDSLFMCTKAQLKISTPTQIRSNIGHSFTLSNYQHDGNICTDLGWHFSWMGDYSRRKIKANSFTHFDDSLSFLKYVRYSQSDSILLNDPKEGDIPPSGDINFVLQNYNIENLPKEIFMFEDIKEFLLPTVNNNKS